MRTMLLTMLCAGLLAFTGCKSMNCGNCSGGGFLSGQCSDGAGCSCENSRNGLLSRMGNNGPDCYDCGVNGCKGNCKGNGGLFGKGGNGNAYDGDGSDGNGGLGGRLADAWNSGKPNPVGHLPKDTTITRRGREIVSGPAGPPTAAYTYPYYTTRGPRDYFDPNPPSIGY